MGRQLEFGETGNIIWGKRTLMPRNSMLDVVNTRRILIFIRKRISNRLDEFKHDVPFDPWWKIMIEEVCDGLPVTVTKRSDEVIIARDDHKLTFTLEAHKIGRSPNDQG